MQQCGVCGTLILREERHVSDPAEPIEGAADLATGIDPERAGADAIGDDDDGRGSDDAAQFRVVAEEAADAQRIGRGDGDDQVGLLQRRERRGVSSRTRNVGRRFLVGLEGARDVDDRLLRPAATHLERGSQT